jgi:hypothetical protein
MIWGALLGGLIGAGIPAALTYLDLVEPGNRPTRRLSARRCRCCTA